MGPKRSKSELKSSRSLWGRAQAPKAKKATTQNTCKSQTGQTLGFGFLKMFYLGQHVSMVEKSGQLLVELADRRAFISAEFQQKI